MEKHPQDKEKTDVPSQGIDPEPEENQEMEVLDQDPERPRNNPNKEKDDSQAA